MGSHGGKKRIRNITMADTSSVLLAKDRKICYSILYYNTDIMFTASGICLQAAECASEMEAF